MNHNSATGALSGYAWSENVGWINFGITANNNDGVSIDVNTLKFSGYAWAENVGFIHFRNLSPEYYVMQEPGAPVATAANAITQTGFTANWNAAAGATGYRLDVATDTGFTSFVSGYRDKDAGTVTAGAVAGITGGTTYYYRVRAKKPVGSAAIPTLLKSPPCRLALKSIWPAHPPRRPARYRRSSPSPVRMRMVMPQMSRRIRSLIFPPILQVQRCFTVTLQGQRLLPG